MANETSIGWTDLSWNVVHGCSKVSPGCAHCYAETVSRRYGFTPSEWTPANAAENVLLKPKKLRDPFSGGKVWRGLGEAAAAAGKTDGKLVFVNSMSDLFHELVPDEFIAAVFSVMARADKHTFQILTKRPERMRDFVRNWCAHNFSMEFAAGPPPHPLENVWLGVSIENWRYVDRADVLRETPAAVRFISAEPLLGPLLTPQCVSYSDRRCESLSPAYGSVCRRCPNRRRSRWEAELDLTDIDWLIVGGESGPGHRPMRAEWARDLLDACIAMHDETGAGGPAFFFKQWGGTRPTSGGRELDGRTWDEFPQVREAVVA